MPDILDELAEILGPAEIAKVRANPALTDKIVRGSEFYNAYVDPNYEPPAATVAPPAAPPVAAVVVPPAVPNETLAQIMAKLDAFGNIDERIDTRLNQVIDTRGSELRGAAVASSIAINRELNRIDARHRTEFGEELDDTKLNAHIDAAQKAGRPFRTVTDAYNDMTSEARLNKTVDTRVREALKAQASQQVPGAAGPSATPMLKVLKTGGANGGGGQTHLDRAAAAASELLAQRGELAS